MIAIGRDALAAIHAHCASAYPLECCGALAGRVADAASHVERVLPLENVADAPRGRFTVSAEEYRSLERRADDEGWTLLGFYHSHPDAEARPSTTDLANAWPNFDYVIVSVVAGTPTATYGWRLALDRTSMIAQELSCPPES